MQTLALLSADVKPRDYQIHIFDKIRKENYLVCLPTGLGKTLLAEMLTAHYLELFGQLQKIVFCAPTRPLIDQQFGSFKAHIKNTSMEILTGMVSPDKRSVLFARANVIFFTPETLRNDVEQKRYTLENTALIIFDEAHRASGDYAYCTIAKLYREQNPEGRILGLTASPGSTTDQIQNLCRELFIPITNIEFRNKEDSDVAAYTHNVSFNKIGVEMSPEMAKIHKWLMDLFDNVAMNLIQIVAEHEPLNLSLEDIRQQKKLVDLQQKFQTRIREMDKSVRETDPEQKRYYYISVSVVAQLMKLIHFIKIVEVDGLLVLKTSMDQMLKKIQDGKGSKADSIIAGDPRFQQSYTVLKKLESNSNDASLMIHPKMLKLKDLLHAEFKVAPNTRILIFCKLRTTVQILVKGLKEEQGFRPVKFVGQAKKNENDKGMSQKEQLAILEEFKQGKVNILVATNVAEEGLDIAECTMVIFYDNVASDIRYIQRKGRTGRSQAGKVVLLYTIGTSDEIAMTIGQLRSKKLGSRIHALRGENEAIESPQQRLFIPPKKVSPTPIIQDKSPEEVEIEDVDEEPPELDVVPQRTLIIHPRIFVKYPIQHEIPPELQVIPQPHIFDLSVRSDVFSFGIDFIPLKSLIISPANMTLHNLITQKAKKVDYFFLFVDEIQEEPQIKGPIIKIFTLQYKIHVIEITSPEILLAILNKFFEKAFPKA